MGVFGPLCGVGGIPIQEAIPRRNIQEFLQLQLHDLSVFVIFEGLNEMIPKIMVLS